MPSEAPSQEPRDRGPPPVTRAGRSALLAKASTSPAPETRSRGRPRRDGRPVLPPSSPPPPPPAAKARKKGRSRGRAQAEDEESPDAAEKSPIQKTEGKTPGRRRSTSRRKSNTRDSPEPSPAPSPEPGAASSPEPQPPALDTGHHPPDSPPSPPTRPIPMDTVEQVEEVCVDMEVSPIPTPVPSPCSSGPQTPCEPPDSPSPLYEHCLSDESGRSPTASIDDATRHLTQCAFCLRGALSPLGQGPLVVFGPTPGYIPLHVLNLRSTPDRDNDCHDHVYRHRESMCSSPEQCESSFDLLEQLGPFGLPSDADVQTLFDPTGQCCAHLQCAAWSDGVSRGGEGQSLQFVDKAIDSASTQVCAFCRQLGASLRCRETSCGRSYHFPCAAAASANQEWSQRVTWCSRHAHKLPLQCASCHRGVDVCDVGGSLLMCCSCGDHYHGTCLTPPLLPSPLSRVGWQCARCRVCRTCGLREEGSLLLVCERCDKAYHPHCLSPMLHNPPSTGWSCKSCRVCRRCGARSSGVWANHPSLCEACDPALPCILCGGAPDLYSPQDHVTCICCYRSVHTECIVQAGEARLGAEAYTCATCRPRADPPGPTSPLSPAAITAAPPVLSEEPPAISPLSHHTQPPPSPGICSSIPQTFTESAETQSHPHFPPTLLQQSPSREKEHPPSPGMNVPIENKGRESPVPFNPDSAEIRQVTPEPSETHESPSSTSPYPPSRLEEIISQVEPSIIEETHSPSNLPNYQVEHFDPESVNLQERLRISESHPSSPKKSCPTNKDGATSSYLPSPRLLPQPCPVTEKSEPSPPEPMETKQTTSESNPSSPSLSHSKSMECSQTPEQSEPVEVLQPLESYENSEVRLSSPTLQEQVVDPEASQVITHSPIQPEIVTSPISSPKDSQEEVEESLQLDNAKLLESHTLTYLALPGHQATSAQDECKEMEEETGLSVPQSPVSLRQKTPPRLVSVEQEEEDDRMEVDDVLGSRQVQESANIQIQESPKSQSEPQSPHSRSLSPVHQHFDKDSFPHPSPQVESSEPQIESVSPGPESPRCPNVVTSTLEEEIPKWTEQDITTLDKDLSAAPCRSKPLSHALSISAPCSPSHCLVKPSQRSLSQPASPQQVDTSCPIRPLELKIPVFNKVGIEKSEQSPKLHSSPEFESQTLEKLPLSPSPSALDLPKMPHQELAEEQPALSSASPPSPLAHKPAPESLSTSAKHSSLPSSPRADRTGDSTQPPPSPVQNPEAKSPSVTEMPASEDSVLLLGLAIADASLASPQQEEMEVDTDRLQPQKEASPFQSSPCSPAESSEEPVDLNHVHAESPIEVPTSPALTPASFSPPHCNPPEGNADGESQSAAEIVHSPPRSSPAGLASPARSQRRLFNSSPAHATEASSSPVDQISQLAEPEPDAALGIIPEEPHPISPCNNKVYASETVSVSAADEQAPPLSPKSLPDTLAVSPISPVSNIEASCQHLSPESPTSPLPPKQSSPTPSPSPNPASCPKSPPPPSPAQDETVMPSFNDSSILEVHFPVSPGPNVSIDDEKVSSIASPVSSPKHEQSKVQSSPQPNAVPSPVCSDVSAVINIQTSTEMSQSVKTELNTCDDELPVCKESHPVSRCESPQQKMEDTECNAVSTVVAVLVEPEEMEIDADKDEEPMEMEMAPEPQQLHCETEVGDLRMERPEEEYSERRLSREEGQQRTERADGMGEEHVEDHLRSAERAEGMEEEHSQVKKPLHRAEKTGETEESHSVVEKHLHSAERAEEMEEEHSVVEKHLIRPERAEGMEEEGSKVPKHLQRRDSRNEMEEVKPLHRTGRAVEMQEELAKVPKHLQNRDSPDEMEEARSESEKCLHMAERVDRMEEELFNVQKAPQNKESLNLMEEEPFQVEKPPNLTERVDEALPEVGKHLHRTERPDEMEQDHVEMDKHLQRIERTEEEHPDVRTHVHEAEAADREYPDLQKPLLRTEMVGLTEQVQSQVEEPLDKRQEEYKEQEKHLVLTEPSDRRDEDHAEVDEHLEGTERADVVVKKYPDTEECEELDLRRMECLEQQSYPTTEEVHAEIEQVVLQRFEERSLQEDTASKQELTEEKEEALSPHSPPTGTQLTPVATEDHLSPSHPPLHCPPSPVSSHAPPASPHSPPASPPKSPPHSPPLCPVLSERASAASSPKPPSPISALSPSSPAAPLSLPRAGSLEGSSPALSDKPQHEHLINDQETVHIKHTTENTESEANNSIWKSINDETDWEVQATDEKQTETQELEKVECARDEFESTNEKDVKNQVLELSCKEEEELLKDSDMEENSCSSMYIDTDQSRSSFGNVPVESNKDDQSEAWEEPEELSKTINKKAASLEEENEPESRERAEKMNLSDGDSSKEEFEIIQNEEVLKIQEEIMAEVESPQEEISQNVTLDKRPQAPVMVEASRTDDDTAEKLQMVEQQREEPVMDETIGQSVEESQDHKKPVVEEVKLIKTKEEEELIIDWEEHIEKSPRNGQSEVLVLRNYNEEMREDAELSQRPVETKEENVGMVDHRDAEEESTMGEWETPENLNSNTEVDVPVEELKVPREKELPTVDQTEVEESIERVQLDKDETVEESVDMANRKEEEEETVTGEWETQENSSKAEKLSEKAAIPVNQSEALESVERAELDEDEMEKPKSLERVELELSTNGDDEEEEEEKVDSDLEDAVSPVLDLDPSLDMEVMALMSSASPPPSLLTLTSPSPTLVMPRRGKGRSALRSLQAGARAEDDLTVRLRQSPFSTEASPENSPNRLPVTPPPLSPLTPPLRGSPSNRESPPLSRPQIPPTVIPFTPKIGMGKPAITKRKFSPGRARARQCSWWSSRRAVSPPSSSQDSGDGWDSPKPRSQDSPLWGMKTGRGSGFPGRRRSRGGGIGSRGGRGRSRLKTQDSLTVSPGGGYMESFQMRDEEENSMHNTVVMFSTSDHFTLKQDMCVVCGSFGQGEEGRLLACSQCGQCYHPYCVNVKITRVILTKGWRCLECTVCEACGEASDPGRLLLCDDCDISFHTYCLDPPLHTVPKGAWKCKWCVWCVQCGSTSPGLHCDWLNNYSLCGPCSSLSRCPLCQRPYSQDDLIMQCQQCDRWVHAVCHGLMSEEEVESSADEGFNCSLCKNHGRGTFARSDSFDTPYMAQIVSRFREPDLKTYTQDGVCLTESGLSHLQSLVEPLTSPRRYRRNKPKLKLRIINQNSVSVLQTPEPETPTEPEPPRDMDCEMKSDSSPERDHPHEDYGLKEAETADGKKRKRKPYRPGIGGFMVRQRGGKGPSRIKLCRSDSTDTYPGRDDDGDAMDTSVDHSMEKAKKRYRKKRTKLEETFPSYLQEAFFGRDLLDRSRLIDRRPGPDAPALSQSGATPASGPTKGPAHLSHGHAPQKQRTLPVSEEALVDLSDVLNTDPHILATGQTGQFQGERSPSPFAGLDISPMDSRPQRSVQDEPLDAILSPELDKMVSDGAILSKLYNIPELEGKDVEEVFTAVLSPNSSGQSEPPTANKPHPPAQGGPFPRLPLMNGLMGSASHFPGSPMMPMGPQATPRFRMASPHPSSSAPSAPGPAHHMQASNQACSPAEDQDVLSTAQRGMLKWEKEEPLGEQATVAPVLYCNIKFPQLKEQYPDWPSRMKQIAKLWRKASSQDRAPFVQKARDNRAAQRINKVQLPPDPLKRHAQPPPPCPAPTPYDPVAMETDAMFKDPLRPKESEQEQEWKMRQGEVNERWGAGLKSPSHKDCPFQASVAGAGKEALQMRQKSKQLAKIEATQKLEQVKNEQLLQQRQQQLLTNQRLCGGVSPETGSRSPMTPGQQAAGANAASGLVDDVFLRPQAPPLSGFSPSSPQMFSPPSSRPSSPWDPYGKVVGTPRPPSAPQPPLQARRNSLSASPAHDALGSPAPSPDAKTAEMSRNMAPQQALPQARPGMLSPSSLEHSRLSALRTDPYQRPVFKAPMPPHQQDFSGPRRDPTRPTDLGFPLNPPQDFPSSPLSGLGSPHRSPYSQGPGTPRPEYSQQTDFSHQSPLSSRPSPDPYSNPQTPGTPRFPRSPVGTPRPSPEAYTQGTDTFAGQGAAGSSPRAPGLSADTATFTPHHQLQRSPGRPQQQQPHTPKHVGMSEESSFAPHTPVHDPFEQSHMAAVSDKPAAANELLATDGALSIMPQMGDSEDKLRQRQRLRQLILRQQQQKSALRQEKGLQEHAPTQAPPLPPTQAPPTPGHIPQTPPIPGHIPSASVPSGHTPSARHWPQEEPDPFGRPPPPYPGMRPVAPPPHGGQRFPAGLHPEQLRGFPPTEAGAFPRHMAIRGPHLRFSIPPGPPGLQDSFMRPAQGPVPVVGLSGPDGIPVPLRRPVPPDFTGIRALPGPSAHPHMMQGVQPGFMPRSVAVQPHPSHSIMGQPYIELRHRAPELRLRLPFPEQEGPRPLHQQEVPPPRPTHQAMTLAPSAAAANVDLPVAVAMEEHLETEDSAVKDLEDVEVKDLVDLNLNLDPEDGKEDLDLAANDLHLDDFLLSGKFDLIAYTDPELNLDNEDLDLDPVDQDRKEHSGQSAASTQIKQEVKDGVKKEGSVAQSQASQPGHISTARPPGPGGVSKEKAEGSSLQTQSQTSMAAGPVFLQRPLGSSSLVPPHPQGLQPRAAQPGAQTPSQSPSQSQTDALDPSKPRPLLLEEQPLLLQELLDQERQEQQQQKQMQALIRQRSSTDPPLPNMDFDSITDPIMKAKMVALKGINKFMAQGPLGMNPMVRLQQQQPTAPTTVQEGAPQTPHPPAQDGKLNPQMVRPNPPNIGPGFVNEGQRRQYEEWLGETQRLLQMQQRLLEDQIASHRKTKKALSAKQRTAKKAGRPFAEEDAAQLRYVTEQQGAVQKQLEQIRKQQKDHTELIEDYRAKHQPRSLQPPPGVPMVAPGAPVPPMAPSGPGLMQQPLGPMQHPPRVPVVGPGATGWSPAGGVAPGAMAQRMPPHIPSQLGPQPPQMVQQPPQMGPQPPQMGPQPPQMGPQPPQMGPQPPQMGPQPPQMGPQPPQMGPQPPQMGPQPPQMVQQTPQMGPQPPQVKFDDNNPFSEGFQERERRERLREQQERQRVQLMHEVERHRALQQRLELEHQGLMGARPVAPSNPPSDSLSQMPFFSSELPQDFLQSPPSRPPAPHPQGAPFAQQHHPLPPHLRHPGPAQPQCVPSHAPQRFGHDSSSSSPSTPRPQPSASLLYSDVIPDEKKKRRKREGDGGDRTPLSSHSDDITAPPTPALSDTACSTPTRPVNDQSELFSLAPSSELERQLAVTAAAQDKGSGLDAHRGRLVVKEEHVEARACSGGVKMEDSDAGAGDAGKELLRHLLKEKSPSATPPHAGTVRQVSVDSVRSEEEDGFINNSGRVDSPGGDMDKKARFKRLNRPDKDRPKNKRRKRDDDEVLHSNNTGSDAIMTHIRQLSVLPLMEPVLRVDLSLFPPYGSSSLGSDSRLSGSFGNACLDGVTDYYSQLIYKQNNLSNPPTPPASLPPTPPPVARQKLVNGFATTEELARKELAEQEQVKAVSNLKQKGEELLSLNHASKTVDVPASLPTPPHNNQEEIRGQFLSESLSPDEYVPSSSPESVADAEISRYPDLSYVKLEPPSPCPSPTIPIMPCAWGKGSALKQEVKSEPNLQAPPSCSNTDLVTISVTLNPLAAQNVPGVMAAVAQLLRLPVPLDYQLHRAGPERSNLALLAGVRVPMMQGPGLVRAQRPPAPTNSVRMDLQPPRPHSCGFCKLPLGNGVRIVKQEGQSRPGAALVFCSSSCSAQYSANPQNSNANKLTSPPPGKTQHHYANNMSSIAVHTLPLRPPPSSGSAPSPPLSFPPASAIAMETRRTDSLKVKVKLKPRPRAVPGGEEPRHGKRSKSSRWRRWSISITLSRGTCVPTEPLSDEEIRSLGSCLRPEPLPKDLRRCCFCSQNGDGDTDGPARLLNLDLDLWVHLNCALWSSEVYETQAGALINVELALRRGLTLRCAHCQQTGATSGCNRLRCTNTYHFTCALQAQCTFFKDKTMLCHLHKPRSLALSPSSSPFDPAAPSDPYDSELRCFAVFRRVYVQRDEARQIAAVVQRGERQHTFRVGSLLFRAVGRLLPSQLQAFHNSTAIWPVGYHANRLYWSMRHHHRRCKYQCYIEEKDSQPVFKIKVVEKGHDDLILTGASPKAVWEQVLEPVAQLRASSGCLKLFPIYLKGEDLFGLTTSAITRIIESLPGVEGCERYSFRFGKNPLMEWPLAFNPSGSARSEPKISQAKRPYLLTSVASRCQGSVGSIVGLVPGQLSLSPGETVAGAHQGRHSKSAQYRRMTAEWKSNVYLARSRIQGLGLYAARDIEKCTMVIEYIGTIIRSEVANRKERLYESQNRGVYMFRIDNDYVIDATITGGPARYINHSCAPNCITEVVTIEKENKIIISSCRRIQRGEELSYDYKFDFEDDQHKIPCHCGAVNCRKWMN